MKTCTELQAVTTDLVALEAIVRALAQVQARRSPTSLGDLLQALTREADRLHAGCSEETDTDGAAKAVVESWIEYIKDEAIAA